MRMRRAPLLSLCRLFQDLLYETFLHDLFSTPRNLVCEVGLALFRLKVLLEQTLS